MRNELTLEERATNAETSEHIRRVQQLLHVMVGHLLRRADDHDQSKLRSPEVEIFTEFTAKLKTCTYGSDEYKGFLESMGPALDHHYANNSHHPEHFKNGIDDMTLLDLLEMFCDWRAASERHDDGNIRKSIEINGKRFEMSPQLIRVFENTIQELP